LAWAPSFIFTKNGLVSVLVIKPTTISAEAEPEVEADGAAAPELQAVISGSASARPRTAARLRIMWVPSLEDVAFGEGSRWVNPALAVWAEPAWTISAAAPAGS